MDEGRTDPDHRDNPAYEAARKVAHDTPGLRGEVTLEWLHPTEGFCVACGSWAYTSYQGTPIHMSCAADVALVAALVEGTLRVTPGARPIAAGKEHHGDPA